jgi:hypothetical protein
MALVFGLFINLDLSVKIEHHSAPELIITELRKGINMAGTAIQLSISGLFLFFCFLLFLLDLICYLWEGNRDELYPYVVESDRNDMTEMKSKGQVLFRENAAFRDLYKCEPKGARNGYVRMRIFWLGFRYVETANALEMEKISFNSSELAAIDLLCT